MHLLHPSHAGDVAVASTPGADLCVQKVYHGKMDDWIQMPFGMVRGVGRGTGVLDGGGDLRRGRGSFGVNLGRPIVTNGAFVTRFLKLL